MKKTLISVFAAILIGCDNDDGRVVLVTPPPAECVIAARGAIIAAFGGETNGVEVVDFKVGEMTAADWQRQLTAIPSNGLITVWMPGAKDWLVLCHRNRGRVRLLDMMEALSDSDSTVSVTEIFASYAGTRAEIMPAFETPLTGFCLPEWFITKDVPKLDWLDVSDIEPDILQETLDEIRSKQVMRRMLLEGNIKAVATTDGENSEKAIECWSRVNLRNPRDTMLMERIETLRRNAAGFLEVGKIPQAMKCFETLILINPNDAAAIRNFGLCVKRIGRLDLAEKILERAKTLEDAR